MIKTQKEYLEAKKRVAQEFKNIKSHEKKMKEAGLTKSQIRLASDPLLTFTYQLKEEVEEYERLMKGQFGSLENLNGIGHILVALRIFKGIKQKDLAKKLGVPESQVSRDERNEYHGASVEKIQNVLDKLGVKLKTTIDLHTNEISA